MAREAYKHLNNGGRIILTSSNTAEGFVIPKHSLYSGSKGAIESFVPVLAVDCGKKRITVNAVAPGGTVTDMFHATARDYIPHSENMTDDQIMKVSPSSRQAFPPVSRTVADCVLLLQDGLVCLTVEQMWPAGRRCALCLVSGKQGGRMDQRQGVAPRWWRGKFSDGRGLRFSVRGSLDLGLWSGHNNFVGVVFSSGGYLCVARRLQLLS